MDDFLIKQGVPEELLKELHKFREYYKLDLQVSDRVPKPHYKYYGTEILTKSIAALLSGYNILLSGPKATGKNVLAENLAMLFGRPMWNISMNITSDSASLLGTDTFINNEVVLRKGPVYSAAEYGGFAVFDEINMAKNDSLSVIYSALDYRRVIDIPGYKKVDMHEATRFIGTMNYGYIGTKELNEALVSRFLVIDMPIISEDNLKMILKEEFDLNNEYLDLFVRLFMDLQKKSLNAEISSKPIDMRGLFSSIETMKRGLPIKLALEMGIVNKTFDAYEREVVSDVINSLFKDDLKSSDIFKVL
ncbi:AAA family ATPase [Peptostreptococcus canis]|uniref:MoxR family ATPase n=1 Tax=Peptostreptococcus canis TaxID=1159213 RepID=A0ABR6TJK0_9FIRM|nr:MoxR family ATPase [Peptostreptococcus canis]MBC2575597.1 MoxR family ATPase [Peptostreptococcus canis]MBP1997201.1 MoxR-like ATPase [Peptostreptococcus canis]